MLLRYKAELNGIPWGIVLGCFTLLVMVHFMLREVSPWSSDLAQAQIATNDTEVLDVGSRIPMKLEEDYGKSEYSNGFGKPETKYTQKTKLKMMPSLVKGPGNPAMYPEPSDEEYVAICMAVKDQYEDLKEVAIHHYHHLGIRRFYFMDDGSDPPLSSFKDYGIPREHITFHYYNRTTDHKNDMQDHVYNECINLYREKHRWMAFFDADEMLEMTGEETLKEMLQRMEKNRSIGALAVQWMTHTSNGLLTRPESTRKAFTDCIWDGLPTHNLMFKSIVKTEFHNGQNHVHQAHLAGDTQTVGEDGINCPTAARTPITRNRIALHHYALKSREEYEQKIARSNAMDQPKGWSFWDEVESQGGVDCPEMAKYEP